MSQKLSNQSAKRRRLPPSLALLHLRLDGSGSRSRLYQQIRDGIRAAIVSGELGGHRLPPTREMAAALGVNRATVTRAYQELEADGLVELGGARGTVVVADESLDLPANPAWVTALPPFDQAGLRADATLIRDITQHSRRSDVISLAAGAPGAELLPVERMQQAVRTGARRWGAGLFGYAPVEGLEVMREALAETLARPLLRAGERLMVVSGATQGLSLAACALIEPGDEVVVEAPTYFGILQTFALAGARLLGVRVDAHGLRVDELEALLARRRVRLIVVQPRFQNPTGTVLSAERRAQLLLLAHRHAVPVLEDDLYGDLDLDGRAPGPLKQDDRYGSVIYLSSFSKSVSPGLRVGWVAALEPVIDRLAVAKQFSDLTSNSLGQVAMADLLRSGDYASHLSSLKEEYRVRRAALIEALDALQGRVELPQPPAGGAHLWCRLRPGIDARSLAVSAIRRQVAITPGEAFFPPSSVRGETGQDRIRLSFMGVPAARMAEGVSRLAQALDDLPSPTHVADAPAGVLV
jgi:DNA-binding transcriptional MocR family regulator